MFQYLETHLTDAETETVCEYSLVTKVLYYRASDASVYGKIPSGFVTHNEATRTLTFDAELESQINTVLQDGTNDCVLDNDDVLYCDIEFVLKDVGPVNGTIEWTTAFRIRFYSECWALNSADPSDYWHEASATDQFIWNHGYRIRDPRISFFMPKNAPTLASGVTLETKCGPLVYNFRDDNLPDWPGAFIQT